MDVKKTSSSYWKTALSREILKLKSPARNEKLRLAVLGIGNEMNGDDAAGVLVARRLFKCVGTRSAIQDWLLVLEGGVAPENFTGPLRRFKPDLVIFIDAADMDTEPGHIELVPWQQADGLSVSTHTLPLSMLAGYLVEETGCQVVLLAIQATQTQPGMPISHPVDDGILDLVQFMDKKLSRLDS
jgi:hydrogenase 3 maturation protease